MNGVGGFTLLSEKVDVVLFVNAIRPKRIFHCQFLI